MCAPGDPRRPEDRPLSRGRGSDAVVEAVRWHGCGAPSRLLPEVCWRSRERVWRVVRSSSSREALCRAIQSRSCVVSILVGSSMARDLPRHWCWLWGVAPPEDSEAWAGGCESWGACCL